MLTIREKIVFFCHSTYDISTDKLESAKLKIVGCNKRSKVFKVEDDDTEVDDFIKMNELSAPYQIIMPLNFEGVGGGTS